MSHFTVLVIGEDPEEQLAPYDENIRADEHVTATVSDEEKMRFLEYYAKKESEKENKKGNADVNVVISLDDFPKYYQKYGNSWNSNSWRVDSDGVWKEYSTYNPKSKWDWYQLGGRWRGFFKMKKMMLLEAGKVFFNEIGFSQGEVENLIGLYQNNKKAFDKTVSKYNGKSQQIRELVEKEIKAREKARYPEHVVGEAGTGGNSAEEGWADQLLKKHVDFEGMRKDAEEQAAKRYDEAMAVIGHLPVNETWEVVRDRIMPGEYDEELMKKAREAYGEQPRVKAWEKKKDVHPFGPGPDDYIISREQFIRNARNNAVSTYAIVKDGEWIEKGKMGWWGMSDDKFTQEQWDEKFNQLLDELPDDTLLSVYDCHI